MMLGYWTRTRYFFSFLNKNFEIRIFNLVIELVILFFTFWKKFSSYLIVSRYCWLRCFIKGKFSIRQSNWELVFWAEILNTMVSYLSCDSFIYLFLTSVVLALLHFIIWIMWSEYGLYNYDLGLQFEFDSNYLL